MKGPEDSTTPGLLGVSPRLPDCECRLVSSPRRGPPCSRSTLVPRSGSLCIGVADPDTPGESGSPISPSEILLCSLRCISAECSSTYVYGPPSHVPPPTPLHAGGTTPSSPLQYCASATRISTGVGTSARYNVISAVPSNMRLALPLSHDDLLPFEFRGSLEGGHLLHLTARRNGRAFSSRTAIGGGLLYGVNGRPGDGLYPLGSANGSSGPTSHTSDSASKLVERQVIAHSSFCSSTSALASRMIAASTSDSRHFLRTGRCRSQRRDIQQHPSGGHAPSRER